MAYFTLKFKKMLSASVGPVNG